MNDSTKFQVYFYVVLLVSIIWLFLFSKSIRNFAPIIFVIPTFPVFLFKYYTQLLKFSNILKTVRPDLFKKYVVDYGSAFKGQVVEIGLISKNKDFEMLEDLPLRDKYFLIKQSIKLAMLSFVIFPVLGIATIYI